jgi:hypothetical protein
MRGRIRRLVARWSFTGKFDDTAISEKFPLHIWTMLILLISSRIATSEAGEYTFNCSRYRGIIYIEFAYDADVDADW